METLRAARRAVPLVPGTVDDCCARLQDRMGLPSRDEARTWLTFLRALGLVEQKRLGYARTRADPGGAELARRFHEGVFVVREALDALAAADGPLTSEAVYERVEDVVPQWERHRDSEWQETWRERIDRLLEWAVLLGLAERADEGYVIADRPA